MILAISERTITVYKKRSVKLCSTAAVGPRVGFYLTILPRLRPILGTIKMNM